MISEIDQQQLDELLDGQLASSEAQRLNRRLAAEPELAGELATLRAERAIRQNVFAAIAPEPAAAEAFSRRVVSASRRQALRARLGGPMRIGGGIAACIALGFMGGWFGRGHGAMPAPAVPSPIAENRPSENAPTVAVADNSDIGKGDAANSQLSGPYEVSVTDLKGHVVTVQKFDRIEDANAFSDWMVKNAPRGQTNADNQQVANAAAL